MLLTGLIGYFGAEMLLKKSFRVFRRGWIGAAAVAAVLIALGVGMSLDLTGFERFVPTAEQIEDVDVRISGARRWGEATFTSDDARSFELLRAAHGAVIADRTRQQRLGRAETAYDGEILQFAVDYQLKSGRHVQRQYTVYVTDADLRNPDSPYSCIDTLQQDPAFAYSFVFGTSRANALALQPHIYGAYLTYRAQTARYEETPVSAQQARDLCAAAVRDIEAGRATRAFTDEPQDTLYELSIFAAAPKEDDAKIPRDMNLIVYDGMSETIALLESMDLN
jgi:ABC-2 type transport system permease protein